jgi:hypothetical protein
MGTISLTQPTAATTITAGLHATNYGTIQTVVNGNLEDINIKTAAAIGVAKLAAGSAGQVLTTTGGVAVWAAPASSVVPYATTLPGGPTDGQEAILVDSTTAPTYQWRFRWNNSSVNTDKWELVGGVPAVVEIATAETTTSASYVDLATAGPSFTVPKGGVYEISLGSEIYASVLTALRTIKMAAKLGAAAAADAESCGIFQFTAASTEGISATVAMRRTLAASDVVKCQYKISGETATFKRRWLRVQPVRVS